LYGFAFFGLDVPFALPSLARFCTPGVVGGVVILPSMWHLDQVYYHHHQYHQQTLLHSLMHKSRKRDKHAPSKPWEEAQPPNKGAMELQYE
jgi:hypothetical protein